LAHQMTETQFSARCPLRFIAMGQRERARRLQSAAGERSGIDAFRTR
jgi:hypothetical protein